jgi:hypothetical protein
VTGTIIELNGQRRLGSIRANDGSMFTFYDAGVPGGQFDFLKIGQSVNFEVVSGVQPHNATGIRSVPASTHTPAAAILQNPPAVPKIPGHAEVLKQLLYSGFDQPKNIRHYKFSVTAQGKAVKHFTVSVDMALFLKYHIGIQEAPALCLQKLSRTDLQAPQVEHELTDEDLASYVSDRAAAAARNLERRKWPKPRRPVPAPSV